MSAAAYRLPDTRENIDDSPETTERLRDVNATNVLTVTPADYTIPIAQFSLQRDFEPPDADGVRCIILSTGTRQLSVSDAGVMLLDGELPKDDRSVVEFLREYGTLMAKTA